MNTEVVPIETAEGLEVIIGQGNFTVKTIDDFHSLLYSSAPGIKFGAAMNEAKPKLARVVGNEPTLKELAAKTALAIGAGHIFVIYLKGAYPIHVLNSVKEHPCVCNIYVATSNPLQVLVATTELGRAVVGVVDGSAAKSIETDSQKEERRAMVKKFGYVPQ